MASEEHACLVWTLPNQGFKRSRRASRVGALASCNAAEHVAHEAVLRGTHSAAAPVRPKGQWAIGFCEDPESGGGTQRAWVLNAGDDPNGSLMQEGDEPMSKRAWTCSNLVWVAVVVAGCASTKKPPTPRPASAPCAGQAVLVIDNMSGYQLDVIESKSYSGGRTVIGTVGNGHHEILVRREGGYYYSTRRSRGGPTEAAESMRASAGDQVRIDRECRTN